jgi:hypothetical protein
MFQLYLAILGLIGFLSLKPEFAKSIGIKLIYNIIYFYSACQIKCTQAYNYLLPYFKNDEKIDEIKIEQFNICNNEILTISKDILETVDKFDNKLFIVSKNIINNIGNNVNGDNSNNVLITNKLIIDKNNMCFSFDVSSITFISLYLNYNGNRFNINLKTDDINYYLVGNKIDKYFVQYYINSVLSSKFSYVEPEYQLELIDHEVNIIYLNSEQSIIIEKDGYHILNNEEDKKDKDLVINEDINEDLVINEDLDINEEVINKDNKLTNKEKLN